MFKYTGWLLSLVLSLSVFTPLASAAGDNHGRAASRPGNPTHQTPR
jgi:hypothetical protein